MTVLNRHSDFLSLQHSGKRLFLSNWMSVNLKKNEMGQFRCGWTLSRKVGSAVTRNKLKRWCREYFRTQIKTSEPFVDLNVVLRVRDKDFYRNLTYNEFRKCLDKAWGHALQTN
ncbi:MAG: ribonuclease P protein component [Bdellovibrionales bacterium]|nr:ribonuclease P protein component [Bdellovibrionales bacterium]